MAAKDRRRGRRGPTNANRQRRGIPRDRSTLVLGGVSAVLLGLVAVVFILAVANPSQASDFDLSLYQGQQKLGTAEPNFNDLLDDGRPIVLNFWGGDCPPCRAEMPGFQRFYEEHEGDLTLIGLDVGRFFGLGTEQSALRLLEELEITYPAGKPRDGSAVNGYNVRGLPATVFFDADGQVFRQWDGLISEDQLQDVVEAMLGSS